MTEDEGRGARLETDSVDFVVFRRTVMMHTLMFVRYPVKPTTHDCDINPLEPRPMDSYRSAWGMKRNNLCFLLFYIIVSSKRCLLHHFKSSINAFNCCLLLNSMPHQLNGHLWLPTCWENTVTLQWHSPFVLSRASCRPRFLPGFRTQWLLVAVISNTSQPSSAAQITRESSRKRSDSLEEENEGLYARLQKIGRSRGTECKLKWPKCRVE